MGFLIIVGASLMGLASFLMSFSVVKSEIQAKNNIDEYLKIKTEAYFSKTLPVQKYKQEEIETALIRACQLAQAMIIRCQNCYTSGYSFCPYPTNQFCQSAKGVNYNDASIVWSFLPNISGSLTEILTGSSINVNNLTNVSQLGQGIRWVLQRQFDGNFFNGYRYIRPQGVSTDACAVEGIVYR